MTVVWEHVDDSNKHISVYRSQYEKFLLTEEKIKDKNITFDKTTGRPSLNPSICVDDAIRGVRLRTNNILQPDGTKKKERLEIPCLWYCVSKKQTMRTQKRKFTTEEECHLEELRLSQYYEKNKKQFHIIETTRLHEATIKKRKSTNDYKEVEKRFKKHKMEELRLEMGRQTLKAENENKQQHTTQNNYKLNVGKLNPVSTNSTKNHLTVSTGELSPEQNNSSNSSTGSEQSPQPTKTFSPISELKQSFGNTEYSSSSESDTEND